MDDKSADTTDNMSTTETAPIDDEQPGSARDVWQNRDFRRIFLASFASSTGRWMQNVALGVFAFKLSGTASFTTLVIAAQLFPLLVLSLVGGSLADMVDRSKLLIVTQAWQAAWGLILAWEVLDDEISKSLLLLTVFMIGIGQALFAPAFTAVVPSLVGRQNLRAAISLNSMQVNGSRIVGPVIGAALMSVSGISEVFVLNSLTYIIIIGVIYITPIPAAQTRKGQSFGDRVFGGVRLARRSPQVGRPLAVMVTFAVLCLPFIGLMPVIAERNWGVDSESQTYGNIYAAFGLGALVGAISVGTILLKVPQGKVVRITLVGFAASLAALASLDSAGPVFPVIFLVGLFYFTMPTALSTFLQEHLGDEVRGRVMALWVVSFGGILSVTNLFSGIIVDATSSSAVLYGGAIAALLLGITVRLEPGPIATEALLNSGDNDDTVIARSNLATVRVQ